MRPRTLMLRAVSGVLAGSASAVVIAGALGLAGGATTSDPGGDVEFRAMVPAAARPTAVEGATTAIGPDGPVKTGLGEDSARFSRALSTRFGSADEAALEDQDKAASTPPEATSSLTTVPTPRRNPGRTVQASAWRPGPPPAKPEFADLPGEKPDLTPGQEHDDRVENGAAAKPIEVSQTVVPATMRGLDNIDRMTAAEALVHLPQKLASSGTKSVAAGVMAGLLPEPDWAEALPDSDLGELRGAGVEQVVMEMSGDTTVNDQASEIDATMTFDPNGEATLEGTLPNGLSLEGEGVNVETVLDGMENFHGFAQVIQVPGDHNVVTANLLINMYILLNDGVVPPNLVDVSAGMRP